MEIKISTDDLRKKKLFVATPNPQAIVIGDQNYEEEKMAYLLGP
jgi:hypothetical protein